MHYPIVLHSQATINLCNLYCYRLQMDGGKRAYARYKKTNKSVNDVLDRIANEPEHELLSSEIKRLRLEIRMMTKGIPTTEPMTPVDERPVLRSDPFFNEQQYNTYTELLKRAFRKVAALAHPDKGGDTDIFQQVLDAYEQRDLEFLTDIYIRLSTERNLYWQQSEAGLDHAISQMYRPSALEARMKAAPEFAVAQAYVQGNKLLANMLMALQLRDQIAALVKEINFLRNQNERQKEGQESNEGRHQEIQVVEDRQEVVEGKIFLGQRQEGHVSAGEGTPGQV